MQQEMWDWLLEKGVNVKFDISNTSMCVCPILPLKFVEPVKINKSYQSWNKKQEIKY